MFFYAGHGLEESGQNYLVPMDDASKCRNEIEDNGIKLSSIQKQLKDAGAAMSIMIVDACRNQPLPFTCVGSNRGGTSSTFTEFKAKGSYIAFSTAPGQTAADGKGSNSPYTAALSKAIRKEGLKIEDVFKQVRRDLDQIGQETWDNNGYSGDFYFKYKTNTTVTKPDNSPKDSDNDGIIDSKDQCPYEYGEISNNGCPKKATVEYAAEFTENVAGISFIMRNIKSGTFKMGSSDSEASSDETPHTVRLTTNFSLGKTEVTVAQYLKFCDETNSNYPEWLEKGNKNNINTGSNKHYKDQGYRLNTDNLPIVGVSWENAVAYCDWLSKRTGKKYRLPTEAEWEYAAKANGDTKYSGSNNISDVAWYFENSKNKPHVVAQKLPNSLGLYDMTGNVWEFCSDYCDSDYGELITDTYKDSAINPLCKSGSLPVIRGGSRGSGTTDCRVANRSYEMPASRGYYVGFRVALSE